MRKRAFRHDAVPLPAFVSAEDAAKVMLVQTGEAEEARSRMLQRIKIKSEDDSAAEDHRQRMIDRSAK